MKMGKRKEWAVWPFLVMAGFLLAASAVGICFREVRFQESNIVIVYMLSVLMTSRFTKGYAYGLTASVIATFLFNWLFTKPYYSFAVYNPGYLITFVIMTITAIFTSALTTRVKEDAVRAQEKEAEIEQERYRGNLLRAISHDLRTPLSGIMGTSEMLIGMTNEDDPRHEMAVGIHKDADWLHSLVENILSLTRLQDGRLNIKKETEALEEVIGGAIALIAKRAPEQEIQVEMPEEVLMIPMDAKLMEQVFVNLLDNAVKHSEPSEPVTICVEAPKQEDSIRITVADRGEGISETDLPNIFQTFYTSNTRDADSKQGIGLGLAICDTIIKAHGGTIKAGNRAEGKGAFFTFTIPRDKEELSNGALSRTDSDRGR
ncbi:sensor histidine kinase [Anaerostipes sp.]|uniref:sensor histidine kinase n=1 Tax=Anaerostipes sp. TaxID=1872530 RepID=UPI0025B9E9F6|nr:DUF4118 domain-containing protein [Anaerostipes sp.]MBS7007713.1 DUF4118 domain-containing protein [Anaerostipes sp.]